MILPSGCPVLSGTLILGMVTLEGQKYVTVSLVILMVECIHKELHETHDRLQELGAPIGSQVLPNGEEFHMESILQEYVRRRI